MPRIILLILCLLASSVGGFVHAQTEMGISEITISDQSTGKPTAARLHIKDAAGKPQRAGKLPFWFDHFVCLGTVTLELPAGKYTYECERGPEYSLKSGSFTLADKTR